MTNHWRAPRDRAKILMELTKVHLLPSQYLPAISLKLTSHGSLCSVRIALLARHLWPMDLKERLSISDSKLSIWERCEDLWSRPVQWKMFRFRVPGSHFHSVPSWELPTFRIPSWPINTIFSSAHSFVLNSKYSR